MKKKILSIIAFVLIFFSFSTIALAADVEITDDCHADSYERFAEGGIYWTSNSTGYAFYTSGANSGIYYRKTINGGQSWGAETLISDEIIVWYFDSWADWNTPGDSGTKIHFVFSKSSGTDGIRYFYFDTFDDTASSSILVQAGSLTSSSGIDYHLNSITKTRGGVLAVAYREDAGTDTYGFETSVDGGNTWVAKTDCWETAFDHLQLFPANLSDPDDLWGVFWDISSDEISLQTYDYSNNSWSEQSISTGMEDDPDAYLNFDGDIRQSDGNLILAAWDKFSATNTTLKVWDIADASSITEKTEIISGGNGYFQTAVMVDQTTNDIYTTYFKGTIESGVAAYYQKSTNGGTSWGGEVSFSENTQDYRNLQLSGIKESLGGRFMPMYVDADPDEEIDTNYIHSININANVFTDPAIAPDYVIDCPTCTDSLTSSGNFTSNETFTGGPPGFSVIDEAAEDSGAPPIWLWGWIGMFAIMVPGFFVTYMERKYGAGNGTLILRMGIALLVMGLLVTWGRFDWWMIVFYVMLAIAPALMSRQYDFGGAGGISQWGWIGFCGTSWIGLTIINRILEGQFLQSAESSWWCSIQLFNEFRVFDLFTVPVLNFQFFTRGIPALLRWDYSFFGGNAELIQYFLYTITAVVAFILFIILVGLLFNAFRAR